MQELIEAVRKLAAAQNKFGLPPHVAKWMGGIFDFPALLVALERAERVIEAAKKAQGDSVLFRCAVCQHEHYEPVDSFECPRCHNEDLLSMHFSPGHESHVALDAALKSPGAAGAEGAKP